MNGRSGGWHTSQRSISSKHRNLVDPAGTRKELAAAVNSNLEYAQTQGLPMLVLFAGESEPVRVVGVSDMALLEGIWA